MFLLLLLVTLSIAALVSFLAARAFDGSVMRILDRLVGGDLAPAWARYMRFAILVVGISGGVRIYQMERYLESSDRRGPHMPPPVLDTNRWVLEVYGTLIGTLQNIAWVLLVFFLVALLAWGVMRGLEMREKKSSA